MIARYRSHARPGRTSQFRWKYRDGPAATEPRAMVRAGPSYRRIRDRLPDLHRVASDAPAIDGALSESLLRKISLSPRPHATGLKAERVSFSCNPRQTRVPAVVPKINEWD